MTGKLLYSLILEGIVALLIFALVYFLWSKVASTKGIPVVEDCKPDLGTQVASGAPKAL